MDAANGSIVRRFSAGSSAHAKSGPSPPLNWKQVVDATETYLMDAPERERTTSEIGELIMQHLKGLDTVAYIRFASVYRDFKDVREFKEELEDLLESHRTGKQKK